MQRPVTFIAIDAKTLVANKIVPDIVKVPDTVYQDQFEPYKYYDREVTGSKIAHPPYYFIDKYDMNRIERVQAQHGIVLHGGDEKTLINQFDELVCDWAVFSPQLIIDARAGYFPQFDVYVEGHKLPECAKNMTQAIEIFLRFGHIGLNDICMIQATKVGYFFRLSEGEDMSKPSLAKYNKFNY